MTIKQLKTILDFLKRFSEDTNIKTIKEFIDYNNENSKQLIERI